MQRVFLLVSAQVPVLVPGLESLPELPLVTGFRSLALPGLVPRSESAPALVFVLVLVPA